MTATAPSRSVQAVQPALPVCAVCDLAVHLAGETVHPCCAHARARGEDHCGGCRGFEKRRREGLA